MTGPPNIISTGSIITVITMAIITTIITNIIIMIIITRDLIMDNITIKGLIIISIMTKIKALIIIRTGAIRHLIVDITKAMTVEETQEMITTVEVTTTEQATITGQATTQEEPQVGIDIFW
jgi:hypothetical protein